MSIVSKTYLKTKFQTGDKPTQQDFTDFIDSAVFLSSAVASAGAFGELMLATNTTAEALNILGGSAVGKAVFAATTTAAAQNALGGGTVGKQVFEAATTAQAQAIVGGVSTSQTFEWEDLILTPANGDYKRTAKVAFAGTITETTAVTESGTCTLTYKINATPLGGGANSVSSVEGTVTHNSNNAFVAGDDIVLSVSGNASSIKLSSNIVYTRTLA